MRVNVHVDGFNLYFGSLRHQPSLKWLNPAALASYLLRSDDSVHRVRYFTARIDARGDPQAPQRQQTFLRALATLPNLSIDYGQFKTRPKLQRLADPPRGGPSRVRVLVTEEKGSDVNLATYLLWDAFRGDGSASLVISGDTDLIRPVEIVTKEIRRSVGVINGTLDSPPASELLRVASWVKRVRVGALRASQFPDTMVDSAGTFNRPNRWT